jgi:hypothetical protein
MLDHPKAIGDRSVLAVMMALQETGVPFAVPFGENARRRIRFAADFEIAKVSVMPA